MKIHALTNFKSTRLGRWGDLVGRQTNACGRVGVRQTSKRQTVTGRHATGRQADMLQVTGRQAA
jgi:hypothetical protein